MIDFSIFYELNVKVDLLHNNELNAIKTETMASTFYKHDNIQSDTIQEKQISMYANKKRKKPEVTKLLEVSESKTTCKSVIENEGALTFSVNGSFVKGTKDSEALHNDNFFKIISASSNLFNGFLYSYSRQQ